MEKSEGSTLGRWLGRFIQLAIIAGLLMGAGYTGSYWLNNKPKAKRRRRKRQVPLVAVKQLTPSPQTIRFSVLGTVVPEREVKVASLVSGSVKWVHGNFAPGGRFVSGEKILEIDPGQYIYDYEVKKSEMDKARADLSIELGRKSVAEHELKTMPNIKGANRDLILRKPQQARVKATLESAHASASRAWLDIKRTKLKVPFNSMLLSKNVDVGAKLSPGTACGTLVGTDRFWVELLLPKERLKTFSIPGFNATQGSRVILTDERTWGKGATRTGVVLRLLPDLDSASKLAKVLVAVDDPLDLASRGPVKRPLLLGTIVRAEVQGHLMPRVYKVHRDWERNGTLWFFSMKGTLEIRKVAPLWSDMEYLFYTEGITANDTIIVSNLGFAVNGMRVRAGISRGSGMGRSRGNEAKPSGQSGRKQ